MRIFPFGQLRAIIYRKCIVIKRSWRFLGFCVLGLTVFSGLGLLIEWATVQFNMPNGSATTFDSNITIDNNFVIAGKTPNDNFTQQIVKSIESLFYADTNIEPTFVYFNTTAEMQNYIYEQQKQRTLDLNIPFGLDLTFAPDNFTVYYNSTCNSNYKSPEELMVDGIILFKRVLWNTFTQSLDVPQVPDVKIPGLTISILTVANPLGSFLFNSMGSYLLECGVMCIIPFVVHHVLKDIKGHVRPYMMRCTLVLFPYWFGSLILDFALWSVFAFLVWAIVNMCLLLPILDNLFTLWYVLTFFGFSNLLFVYCVSFLFPNHQSGTRQQFILLLLFMYVPMFVSMLIRDNPIVLEWIWSVIPPFALEQLILQILLHYGNDKKSFSYFWSDQHSLPYLIMMWGDIIIYSLLLALIETSRVAIQKKLARLKFSNYRELCGKMKNKANVTEETIQMEQEVRNSDDWAVRVIDVSKLFMNTKGKPIVAVNSVTIGIKQNSIYGFLGANGAGKTTLIKMITGMIPPSSGSIDIFGQPAEELKCETVVSFCPQFSNHLCSELTPKEHFKFYSLLLGKEQNDEQKTFIEQLISEMELDDVDDVPIKSLTMGEVRKLAVALSFLADSKLLILDEPTTGLDPITTHCVQEMILEHKGERTIMLCTHKLSEAEVVCDTISIMIRGTVYIVGSPQYLMQKFGTNYKIDIMLNDTLPSTRQKVDAFFHEKLPHAQMSVKSGISRSYSILNTDVTLPNLFELLQEGMDNDNGFKFFTCSSSSLEKVFSEIVRMSEDKTYDTSSEGMKDSKSDIPGEGPIANRQLDSDSSNHDNESDSQPISML